MQEHPSQAACRARLRFIFEDAVVSYTLAQAPTFGDIAGAMDYLARRRVAAPVGIDVMLAPEASFARATTGSHHAR